MPRKEKIMKNTVQIDKHQRVYVNGTRICKVTNYSINRDATSIRAELPATVKLEFVADKVEFVDEVTEQEQKLKSLYKEALQKQLALLENAQEKALTEGAFSHFYFYSKDILKLANELEEINGKA